MFRCAQVKACIKQYIYIHLNKCNRWLQFCWSIETLVASGQDLPGVMEVSAGVQSQWLQPVKGDVPNDTRYTTVASISQSLGPWIALDLLGMFLWCWWWLMVLYCGLGWPVGPKFMVVKVDLLVNHPSWWGIWPCPTLHPEICEFLLPRVSRSGESDLLLSYDVEINIDTPQHSWEWHLKPKWNRRQLLNSTLQTVLLDNLLVCQWKRSWRTDTLSIFMMPSSILMLSVTKDAGTQNSRLEGAKATSRRADIWTSEACLADVYRLKVTRWNWHDTKLWLVT